MNAPILLHRPASQGHVPMMVMPPAGAARDASATMSELLRLMGADEGEARLTTSLTVSMRRLRAGQALFHEGAPAESIYFVRSGTFKIFHTAEDGYEQVLGFVGRAEVLGFDAVCTQGHPTEAAALEDSSVFALPMHELFALAERSAALARVVHLAVSSALARQGELADVMAAVAAEVRLARFLLHLSQRMAAAGQSPRRFVLRMSRRDIASYLAVAHETVSRSFTALVNWDLAKVDNRDVDVVDMDGLRSLARSTRRQIDEAGRQSLSHATVAHAA